MTVALAIIAIIGWLLAGLFAIAFFGQEDVASDLAADLADAEDDLTAATSELADALAALNRHSATPLGDVAHVRSLRLVRGGAV